MEYRDRMVGGLRKVMEHADLPTGLDGRGYDGVVKQLPVHHLRAGKCEQNSSCANCTHSLDVEALVSTHSLVARIPVFGESGRIENNHVIFTCALPSTKYDNQRKSSP